MAAGVAGGPQDSLMQGAPAEGSVHQVQGHQLRNGRKAFLYMSTLP